MPDHFPIIIQEQVHPFSSFLCFWIICHYHSSLQHLIHETSLQHYLETLEHLHDRNSVQIDCSSMLPMNLPALPSQGILKFGAVSSQPGPLDGLAWQERRTDDSDWLSRESGFSSSMLPPLRLYCHPVCKSSIVKSINCRLTRFDKICKGYSSEKTILIDLHFAKYTFVQTYWKKRRLVKQNIWFNKDVSWFDLWKTLYGFDFSETNM